MKARMALAAAVLLVVAGCGGNGRTEPNKPPEAKPTLSLLTAGQACAQVQQVNDELHGPGRWAIPTYGKFGEETATLAAESVPEIADALQAMSDQAVDVGNMTGGGGDVITAAAKWATQYQVVADICAHTDSPIGRLP